MFGQFQPPTRRAVYPRTDSGPQIALVKKVQEISLKQSYSDVGLL